MARNTEWQWELENCTSKQHYIKLYIEEEKTADNSCKQYKVTLSRLRIGHTRLTYRHSISINSQQPTCRNLTSLN